MLTYISCFEQVFKSKGEKGFSNLRIEVRGLQLCTNKVLAKGSDITAHTGKEQKLQFIKFKELKNAEPMRNFFTTCLPKEKKQRILINAKIPKDWTVENLVLPFSLY